MIQQSKNSTPRVVRADKLKLWVGDEPPPSWLEGQPHDEEEIAAQAEARADQDISLNEEEDQVQDVARAEEPGGQGSEDEAGPDLAPPVRPARTRRPPRHLADYKM